MTGAILGVLNPFIQYVSDTRGSLLGQTQRREVCRKGSRFPTPDMWGYMYE